MKLALMTLGCPAWDLVTVCKRAQEYGYDGIDFRGIQSELDVTRLPAFTTNAGQTRALLADHGLVASGISSSIHICAPTRRDESLDEARRTLDTAVAIGASNIRVFGEGQPDRIGYTEAAKIGAECISAILAIPGARQVSWNFETHDHWVRSGDCRLLLDAVPDSAFGVAFDIAHTKRIGNETAKQTLDALGARLRYVHVKDAVRAGSHTHAMADGWRYVLPGSGELQLDEAIAELKDRNYEGWLMFEHEKRWHPELEEPEIAFPAFARWARRVLGR